MNQTIPITTPVVPVVVIWVMVVIVCIVLFGGNIIIFPVGIKIFDRILR